MNAMARDMKGSGVTVIVLCPRRTRTGFVDSARMERLRPARYGHMATARSFAEKAGPPCALGTRILPRRVVSEIADRILGPG
jgi:short-subunit dehydrogenase